MIIFLRPVYPAKNGNLAGAGRRKSLRPSAWVRGYMRQFQLGTLDDRVFSGSLEVDRAESRNKCFRLYRSTFSQRPVH